MFDNYTMGAQVLHVVILKALNLPTQEGSGFQVRHLLDRQVKKRVLCPVLRDDGQMSSSPPSLCGL